MYSKRQKYSYVCCLYIQNLTHISYYSKYFEKNIPILLHTFIMIWNYVYADFEISLTLLRCSSIVIMWVKFETEPKIINIYE